MKNDSYPKEEMDLKMQILDSKIATNHRETQVELKQHRLTHEKMLEKLEKGFEGVYARQDFTNGKVKKIVIALVAIGAFALGTGLENIGTLLKFII